MRIVPIPQLSSQDELRKLFDSRIQQVIVAEMGDISEWPSAHIALFTGTVAEFEEMPTTVENVHNLERRRQGIMHFNNLPKQGEWIRRSIKFAKSFPIQPSPDFRTSSLEVLSLIYEIPDEVISSGEGYVHSLPLIVHAVPLRGEDPLYFEVKQPDALGTPEDGDMLVINYNRLNRCTEGALYVVERTNWGSDYRVVERQ